MFEHLVQFIRENYRGAGKIVEVGVGHRIDVAKMLKENLPTTEVLVTDKDEAWVRSHGNRQVRAVADDVLFPSLQIYKGASMIYSLHPPMEVIPALEDLARKVGADLLVVPISDEQEAFHGEEWEKVVKEGRVLGWYWRCQQNL